MSRSTLLRGLLVGIAASLAALLLWLFGALELFEARTWDARVRAIAPFREPDSRVVLILLDQASLDWARDAMGLTWPWPREVYSYIVNFVSRADASALAFDVLYLEPSGYGVFDDQSFADSITAADGFVGSLFLGMETGDALQWPESVPSPPLSVGTPEQGANGRRGADAAAAHGVQRYLRASFPIPEVAETSTLLANVQLQPDADGVYRRARPVALFDGHAVPSLGLATWLVGEGVGAPGGASSSADAPVEAITGARALRIGTRHLPLDRSGAVILNFKNQDGRHRDFSAAAILQSEIQILSGEEPLIDPEELQDSYVLFGFSAPGLFDLRTTPIASVVPGVDVHATLLENMLSDDFMRPLPAALVLLMTLILVMAAAMTATVVSGTLRTAAAYLIWLPVPAVAAVAGYVAGFWVPLMVPTVGVVLALAGAGVANYTTEGKQKRYIKNAFQQYLSPAVIEELIQNPERLRLGGERRELSIFFSDLQGFTSLSEGLSPEELTALLNEYLSAMTDIIHQEGGTVDKYEGDAIIAFWNAPLSQDDHALRAVRAALHCQQTLAQLRPAFAQRVGKELHMRIGLNSGPAVVGNMGSRTRFDYTMLGDAVNLAARLEGINKQFGTYTMISESTWRQVSGEFRARQLSRVAVVGRKEPVVVYEPWLPEAYERHAGRIAEFERGLEQYYAGDFTAAEQTFSRIADQDPPARNYLQRCRELQQSPATEWDGVWVMTSK